MPACPSELNALCFFSLYMCYTTIYRIDSTTGVTMNTFLWEQIVLHKQSIRQYNTYTACLTLQVQDHAKVQPAIHCFPGSHFCWPHLLAWTFNCFSAIISTAYFRAGSQRHFLERYITAFRATIITDCKQTQC